MGCKKKENLKNCTCTSTDCKNQGICCDCVRHHRDLGQIPGCFFPKDAEKTYDRSIKHFVEVYSKLI